MSKLEQATTARKGRTPELTDEQRKAWATEFKSRMDKAGVTRYRLSKQMAASPPFVYNVLNGKKFSSKTMQKFEDSLKILLTAS